MEMNEKAQALLSAPLGRALVAHLAGLDAEGIAALAGVDLGGVPYRSAPEVGSRNAGGSRSVHKEPEVPAETPLAQSRADAVRKAVRAAVTARTNPCLLPESVYSLSVADVVTLTREVGDFVEDFAYGAASGWLALQESLAAAATDLTPAARGLAEHPVTAWWWDPAPLDEQRWCGVPPAPRAATADALSQHSGGAIQRWWVAPTIGLGTTRALPPDTCVFALCREGHTTYVALDDEVIAPARVTPGARVYEVSSAQDWVNLVEQYPLAVDSCARPSWEEWSRRSGTWWVPDWGRCAQDWDGIHVSLGGYLSTAYQAHSTRQGLTFLAGWNPDETVWLNGVVDVDGAAARGAALK